MSVYLRGSIYWIEIRTPSGKKVRESAGTKNLIEAQNYHDMRKDQILNGGGIKKPLRNWDEAVELWFKVKSIEKKASSIERDRDFVKWLNQFWKGKSLSQIDDDEVRKVMDRKRRETSASAANKVMGFTRSLFNKLNELGWHVKPIKVKPYKVNTKRVRFLSETEIVSLMRELPEHLRVLVEFSLLTGLRKSNAVRLRWDQVDLKREVLWIDGEEFKTGANHGLPLSSRALELLRSLEGNHETYVFTYKGEPFNYVNNSAWKKALNRAGIKDFRWHDLRHTFASYHAMNGTPLLTLKMLGGWQSLEMVNRYAHLSAEGARQYANNAAPTTTGTSPYTTGTAVTASPVV